MQSKVTGQVDPSVYTDLQELSKLKALASQDSEAALQEVAQQFEQVFMNMMLKSMREANEAFAEDDPLYSSEVQFYQGMLDQQLSLDLSNAGGLGLADIIVKQLSRSAGTSLTEAGAEAALDSRDFSMQLVDMSARRVANHSLNAVEAISEQLTRQQIETNSTSESAVPDSSASEQAGTRAESFASPAEFVTTLLPLAETAARSLGVDPRVLVAQAALETGWGRSVIRDSAGNSSHNLFNIKANSRWQGETVGVQTLEYRDGLPQLEYAQFRAYASLEEGMADYVQLIRNNPRYQQAREQAGDPVAYLQALQQAGYATDPEYASKIERILGGNTLALGDSSAQDG